MLALAAQHVGDVDQLPLAIEDDLAPVDHRVVEPLVAVVLADETLPLRAGFEFDAARARMVGPHEVAGLHRLVLAVDAHGVVRQRAAEVAPPAGLGVIRVGARVDEDLAIADVEHERQRVGVAVRRDAQIPERPRIHQQPHLVGRVEAPRP